MDYEKKYKEVLEKLRNLHNDYDTISNLINFKEELENILPELKESEDERIIKALKEGFKYHQLFNPTFGGVPCTEIVNWIEKQGEKEKFIEKELGNIRGYREEALRRLQELEKQGEQKPVDKLEPKYVPKFHEGDWVACNSDNLRSPLRIVSISDTEYRVKDVRGVPGRPKIEYLDRHYHLWTIQDAKDGDVLADNCKNFNNPFICILKRVENVDFGLTKLSDFSSYCYLTMDDNQKFKEGYYHHMNNIHPATKEQRDLLFQKMYEAGYEWDAERKELCPLSKSEATSDQEQKFAWSEEDEERYLSCLKRLGTGDIRQPETINTVWLKSIKDRVQPKVELTQLDKNILEAAIAFVEQNNHFNVWGGVDKHTVLSALHSIRPQSTWKPSDEQMKQLGWIAKQNKDNMIGKELMTLYNDLKNNFYGE